MFVFRFARKCWRLRGRKIIISHARETHREGTTCLSMSHLKVVALHFEASKWRGTTLKTLVFVIYGKWRGPNVRFFKLNRKNPKWSAKWRALMYALTHPIPTGGRALPQQHLPPPLPRAAARGWAGGQVFKTLVHNFWTLFA